ncbi:host-nuclease inhibitor Gam family protein [Rhodoplanes sp. TEM]|uniref:Host-nuclease inhibitor Gam family protein n=1 Tax=Rhodoplanes tepidamans TaxID=200616 RepID=A0ABT5JCB6_RHOTP|nr:MULTISPECIES: host-nuclease inhibitor Gam family protein [Rhodoplanes]MDC7787336.1 host-nuclease inhibitor Gam family protein [Rhodoplanes tepidamans]MDC7984782.1 host-nuclease inhibitor Gam family protein [Rhodoplanes sp. TEM]MDQ0358247.1 phage host-nuclease inhibitor protein Gam [Rhodoplanes tepidamans]
MAKRTKIAAPQMPVPQSDVEAAAAVARIGELMRELERIKGRGEDQVAAIAAEVNATSAPLRARLRAETEGLRTFCEANRSRLTDQFKRKTVTFETGTAAWRARPASVTLRDKVDEIIGRVKALGLTRFVRTKEEIDKEAMLREPALAKSIVGVSIGSAGEDFVVEPLQMAEAAA